MYGKDWKDSVYKRIVRISITDLAFLKENKGKLSIAGFLHFIIQYYKANQQKDERNKI